MSSIPDITLMLLRGIHVTLIVLVLSIVLSSVIAMIAGSPESPETPTDRFYWSLCRNLQGYFFDRPTLLVILRIAWSVQYPSWK